MVSHPPPNPNPSLQTKFHSQWHHSDLLPESTCVQQQKCNDEQSFLPISPSPIMEKNQPVWTTLIHHQVMASLAFKKPNRSLIMSQGFIINTFALLCQITPKKVLHFFKGHIWYFENLWYNDNAFLVRISLLFWTRVNFKCIVERKIIIFLLLFFFLLFFPFKLVINSNNSVRTKYLLRGNDCG